MQDNLAFITPFPCLALQCKVYTGGLCDTQKSNIVLVDEIDDFAPKDTPENYKIIRILEFHVQFLNPPVHCYTLLDKKVLKIRIKVRSAPNLPGFHKHSPVITKSIKMDMKMKDGGLDAS